MDSGWQDGLSRLMTQYMHHSDLMPISPVIKNCKLLAEHMRCDKIGFYWCLHPSSSESKANSFFICFFFFFFSSDQLIIAVLRDQTGWNLLEVWMWSPSIEEYGNKTSTWTTVGKALEAPRRWETHEEISLGTIFLQGCPITMSSWRNPSIQV